MTTTLLPLGLLPNIGGGELVIILMLVLLLFGGDKMPQLAKGLGKSIREFKKAASDVEQEFQRALDEVPDPTTPPKPAATVKPPVAPTPPVNRIDPPATPPTPPVS